MSFVCRGYLSPEYAYSGHLTRKSDVYSFGVLLLEIVSGRQVVQYHFQHGEQFLVEKVINRFWILCVKAYILRV